MFFKKTVLSAVLAGGVIFSASTAFAYTIPENIRVGLEYKYKNVSTVPVANKEISVGIEKNDRYAALAYIEAAGGFKVTVGSGNIVADTKKSFSDYDDAEEYSKEIEKKYDCDSAPVPMGENKWTVYILGNIEEAKSDIGGNTIVSKNVMLLYDGNDAVMAFDNTYSLSPQIKAEDEEGIITLSDRGYRGVIEMMRNTSGGITAVNVVPFEYYIYSTVPSEMPSTWEKEALKAQAVAARSYTLTRMGVHSDLGYDVCDGINCQIYMGYSQERETVNKYIDETENMVACYKGSPINAVFFSSSGGSTDNSENVWANEIPYLRAVEEINEEKRTWTRTFTAAQMKSMLSAKGINIGDIKNVEVTKTGEYGRVQEVTVTGTTASYVLKQEECRTFASGTSDGSLLSRMYTINDKVIETTNNITEEIVSTPHNYETYMATVNGYNLVLPKDGTIFYERTVVSNNTTTTAVSGSSEDIFVFNGAGSGHGVGMSQYGANGMAQQGYDFEEILNHYYAGITLE